MLNDVLTYITTHWVELLGTLCSLIYLLYAIPGKQELWIWGIISSALYIAVFFHGKFYADMTLQFYYLGVSVYGLWKWRWQKGLTATSSAPPALRATGLRCSFALRLKASAAQPSAEKHTVLFSEKFAEICKFFFTPSKGRGGAADALLASQSEANTPPLDKGRCPKGGGVENMAETMVENMTETELPITSTSPRMWLGIHIADALIFTAYYLVLRYFTDSPLPVCDALTTALSITATWMLAQKKIEYWLVFVCVDAFSAMLYAYRGLYPSAMLFIIYTTMAVIGYRKWKQELETYQQQLDTTI